LPSPEATLRSLVAAPQLKSSKPARQIHLSVLSFSNSLDSRREQTRHQAGLTIQLALPAFIGLTKAPAGATLVPCSSRV
jgi:hypothetical protein